MRSKMNPKPSLRGLVITISLGLLMAGCKVDSSIKGNINPETPTTGAKIVVDVNIQPAFPGSGSGWNNYIKDGQDLACDPLVDTDCEHAGEQMKVELNDVDACANLNITEELGVFSWSCTQAGNDAIIATIGFKDGKGLKDLLDNGGWKENKITIEDPANNKTFQSDMAQWWGNDVAPLPDNSSGGVVNLDGTDDDGAGPDQAFTDGTIFVVSADQISDGYNIGLDNATIVILDGATLTYSGNAANNCNVSTGEAAAADAICLIAAGSQNHLWIEGSLNGDAASGSDAQYGILLKSVHYSELNRVNVSGITTNDGIALYASHHNHLDQVMVTGGGSNGILLSGAENNSLTNVNIASNTAHGISLESAANYNSMVNLSVVNNSNHGVNISSSNFNVFNYLRAANNGQSGLSMTSGQDNTLTHILATNNGEHGIITNASTFNTLTNITATNNGDSGVYLDNVSDNNALVHLVASGNGDKGIHFVSSDFNRISQMVLTDNNNHGLYFIGSGSYDNSFSGNVLLGFNSGDPTNNDCSWNGATDRNDILADCSSATANVLRTVSLSASFEGMLSADDNTNGSNSLGSQAVGSISDWLSFDNLFRTWGQEGSAFPHASSQGACTSGNCHIWDWSLDSAASNPILNKVGDGSTIVNFVENTGCPSAADGDESMTDIQTTPNKFLVNASEFLADGIGDDDGLCESSESCYYNSSFGAHQGNPASPSAGTCIFVNGTDVSSVNMYSLGQ